jgi:sec-independent protein translocase protein TatA
MGSLSIGHWLIVLLIVITIFGSQKIGTLGSDLGKGIKSFKNELKGNNKAEDGRA